MIILILIKSGASALGISMLINEYMGKAIKRRDMTALAEHRRLLQRSPRLHYLFFELTDSCNMRCLHCGSSCGEGQVRFLSEDKVKEVLECTAKAYQAERIMVCFTGGEPMLHPRFLEMAEYASRLGFVVGLTTNGTLITGDTAERIVRSGIRSVSVSMDGEEHSHDMLRAVPGAFERAASGIRELTEYSRGKVSVQITTVFHKMNLDQFNDMLGLAEKLGVSAWRPINIEPIGRALEHPELLLDNDDYVRLLKMIKAVRHDPQIAMNVTYGCSHYLTPEYEREVRDAYFICGAGIMVAGILVNGDIYGCLDIERRPELVQGNIYRDDFVQVWEKGFAPYREDRSARCSACAECSERLFCEGDSMHTWDFDANEPRICVKEILRKEGNNSNHEP